MAARAKNGAVRRSARRALRVGEQLAADVLRARAAALRRRARAVKRRVPHTARAAADPRLLGASGTPARSGILVAEGDSWFDYPWHDVLRMLEDEHGFDVESVAHKGDPVESMAYSGQLLDFTAL